MKHGERLSETGSIINGSSSEWKKKHSKKWQMIIKIVVDVDKQR